MKKTGILGGTFDPIHNGHMFMARQALLRLGLDEIVFIPTGTVPHKDNSHITDSRHRFKMVCEAVKSFENYTVSDTEINRDGVCYTFETLRIFSRENPGNELHFIVGADSVFAIDSWKNPGEIFKYAALTVIGRRTDTCFDIKEFCEKTVRRYNGKIELLDCVGPDISSTAVREILKRGGDASKLVPKPVLDYIKKYGLYERR